jgi:hypothetical protein
MTCDRCGRKTNQIYITEDHEKVCDRTCKGRRSLSLNIDPARSDEMVSNKNRLPEIEDGVVGRGEK